MVLPPDRAQRQRWTFLVLFVSAGWLFWKTAEPLWVPIFLGLLAAVGAHPLHKRFITHSPARATLSAAGLTAGILLGALAIFGFVLAVVSTQLLQTARTVRDQYQHGGAAEVLGPALTGLLVRIGLAPEDLGRHFSQGFEAMAGNVARATGTVVAFSLGGLVMVIFAALTSYYLLREGAEITAWIVDVLPLPDGQVWELVKNFRDVTQAMLLGTGVTALYQAGVSFIGYAVLGIPHAPLWATLTGVASLLPGIGTALIWAPVSIWLLLNGAVVRGPLMLVFGMVLIVGVADYVLRPRLLGSKVRMNELLVFIAIFGGIEAFGLLGLILGPIVTALFVSLVRIYQREYRPR